MLIIVGPSASGKTEIVKTIIKKYQMRKLITYTTRPIRPEETNGVDYHFLDMEIFLKMKSEDFFIETVYYNANYYGTGCHDLTVDKIVILEPSGLKHYLNIKNQQIRVCFLICPKEIRRQRMVERGDDLEKITIRLIHDEDIFSSDVAGLANWVIDSSHDSIETLADKIYYLYYQSLKGEI